MVSAIIDCLPSSLKAIFCAEWLAVQAIGIAEMGALIPAAGKAAVKFAPYAVRKLGDIASDIKYGDASFSATRGMLPEPAAGVGADVSKTKPMLDAEGNIIRGAPSERYPKGKIRYEFDKKFEGDPEGLKQAYSEGAALGQEARFKNKGNIN